MERSRGEEVWLQSACLRALSVQVYLTLCDPVDCGPPGSSVPGILQARILGWVAVPSSRGSSQKTRDEPECLKCPALAGGFFTSSAYKPTESQ